MKMVVFKTVDAAREAQRRADTAAGLPRVHSEGDGPDDFAILNPGEAASSIRAAGVRTDHQYALCMLPDGQTVGLMCPDDPAAVEVVASLGPAPTMTPT